MADLGWLWNLTKDIKKIGLLVMSLSIFLCFLYSVDHALSHSYGKLIFDRKIMLSNNFNDSEGIKHEIKDDGEHIFARKLLTKTVYPLTLTAPFLMENPQICEGQVSVLIIVHTAVYHFERRSQLRQTIAKKDLFKERYTIRIAFLLGTTGDAKLNRLLQHENEQHRDIVQGEFEDTYRNLTLKGVMGFRWISHHCSHADLVLKTDDDVYINIFQLVEKFLPLYGKKTRQIACNKMFPSPVIRSKSRWAVVDDEFRFQKFYPMYCSGFTVLLTTDTIKSLYHAAQFTPVFWVDDVYLFGLLPAMANISHSDISRNVSLWIQDCVEAYTTDNPTLLSCLVAQPYDYAYFWKRSILTMPPEMQKLVNDQILNRAHSNNISSIIERPLLDYTS